MRTQPLYSELRTLYETSADAPNTYRVSIKLKDRIDGARLQTAVEKTMARYPYFKVRVTCEAGKLYFEENPAPFPVIHTDQRIALGDPQTSDHLMAISYWEDQLNIDAYHGLTDGGGLAPLMKTLLYYYCSDYYNAPLSSEGIRLSEEAVSQAEWDDPALRPIVKRLDLPIVKWNKPALQVSEEGIARITPGARVLRMRIPEESFMRFNLSNDGSPATIVALLLARSLDQLHPGAAHPPVIALCVNQRKALRAPLSHQSLVGDVRLPYTKSLKALSFTTQATCFRGIVAIHADDEAILDDILDYQALMQRLDALPLVERQVDCAELVKARSRSISAVVSYVGKANLGDAERYVQHFDVVPSTALPSTQVPLTIELSTLNGSFCLDFIQYFQERDYFSAFAEQLRQNDIDYEILDDIEARFPRFYPSALRHD